MIKLTKSCEDYLETILILQNQSENGVKSVDIATHLNVSKPAVTKATNELKEYGFINKDLYGQITLTNVGKSIAEKIYDKHKTIYSFLKKLGVSDETADEDCCKLEHAISEETFQKLKDFLNK